MGVFGKRHLALAENSCCHSEISTTKGSMCIRSCETSFQCTKPSHWKMSLSSAPRRETSPNRSDVPVPVRLIIQATATVSNCVWLSEQHQPNPTQTCFQQTQVRIGSSQYLVRFKFEPFRGRIRIFAWAPWHRALCRYFFWLRKTRSRWSTHRQLLHHTVPLANANSIV